MIKEFFKLVGNVLAFLALMVFMCLLLTSFTFPGHGIGTYILDVVLALLQTLLLYWLYQKMHKGKDGSGKIL